MSNLNVMKIKTHFTQLVKINSPSGAEQQVAQHLSNWLLQQGFKINQDKTGNIFASKNVFKKNTAPLLLCAHMDTVQPGIGIEPVLENGVFRSKGDTILGADNKASVAAMMVAVENFYSKKINKNKPLEILFTVKEETGGGVDNFDFNLPSAKKVLICDYAKPIGTVALGAPYIQNFNIEFIGKAAHASKPEKGINAFLGLLEFLQKIKVGSLDYGFTTINVGKINGGSGVNTVPESCTVNGEVRSFKEVLFKKHLNRIEKVSKKIAKSQHLEINFTVDGYCPGYLYEESSNHLQEAEKVLKKVTGKKIIFEKTFGVSDANILAPAGFETILISDGVKNPHTVNESIAVKDLELLIKIIEGFLIL